jgi:hypothetical protein
VRTVITIVLVFVVLSALLVARAFVKLYLA